MPPASPVTDARRDRARVELRDVDVPLPRRRGARAAATSPSPRRAGSTHRDHRQHRLGQDHAAQPHPAPVRRDRRRRCSSTASTCATLDPTRCWTRASASCRRRPTCSAAPSRATCATATRTRPTRSCGRRCEIAQAEDFVTEMPRGARGTESPRAAPTVSGGQRQRLAHRARPRARARDLPVRRLVLARSTSRPTRACARRCEPITREATVIVVAQRVSTSSTPTRSSCSTTGRIVGVGTHDELLETCPTYAEIVEYPAAERRPAA